MKHLLKKEPILYVGKVCGISGIKIWVEVAKKKNDSFLLFDGDIVRNIGINSIVEIRKGFLSIVGMVVGEKVEESKDVQKAVTKNQIPLDHNKRIVEVALLGYFDEKGKFSGGTKEFPLISSDVFILVGDKLQNLYNTCSQDWSISVARLESSEKIFRLPIDGLFNSHIAVFGNTGSGKSNTLAALYHALFKTLEKKDVNIFKNNTHFAIFDFNGEYGDSHCITEKKTVYKLSTHDDNGNKIPIKPTDFLDLEFLSVLSDATEKTQKPFLRRALTLLDKIKKGNPSVESDQYFINIFQKYLKETLSLSDKEKADILLEYFINIYSIFEYDASSDRTVLKWQGKTQTFYIERSGKCIYLNSNPHEIKNLKIYTKIQEFSFSNLLLMNQLFVVLYLKLILDIIDTRVNNEFVGYVIHRLQRHQKSIERVFIFNDDGSVWGTGNCVVFNFNQVNLSMKKVLPLLLAKKLYEEQKKEGKNKILNLIIDEAHNILSKTSMRETDSWKDYRLETFEEIIKEGRKFGVFLTIASQRPNDISETIISQAHNYFIHRLVNEKDLLMMANTISYLDKISVDSIPTLPVGTCIFGGTATQMPVKIHFDELPTEQQPQSHTRKYADLFSKQNDVCNRKTLKN